MTDEERDVEQERAAFQSRGLPAHLGSISDEDMMLLRQAALANEDPPFMVLGSGCGLELPRIIGFHEETWLAGWFTRRVRIEFEGRVLQAAQGKNGRWYQYATLEPGKPRPVIPSVPPPLIQGSIEAHFELPPDSWDPSPPFFFDLPAESGEDDR